MPYAIVMTLSPSMTSPAAAEALFRIAAAFIPMAAAAGAGFQLALLGKHRRRAAACGSASRSRSSWIVVGAAAPTRPSAASTGCPPGFWYATRPAVRVARAALTRCAIATPGLRRARRRVALRRKPSDERRQLRLVLAANLVTYAGLVDVGLAYDIGVFPLGWLLSGDRQRARRARARRRGSAARARGRHHRAAARRAPRGALAARLGRARACSATT